MTPTQTVSSWQVRAEAGEPFAVIRVRDLQSTIQAGTDAWGRKNKSQPVFVSAELSMASPFDAASSSDRVSDDTVHYGLLAKAIIASLDGINRRPQPAGKASHVHLRDAVSQIWADLTGFSPDGQQVAAAEGNVGFLRDRISLVRYMNLSVTLPKASLLGSAVSLSTSAVFSPEKVQSPVVVWSSCLRIHELRVPTLIGVNDNERLAKQVVVADVEVEHFDATEDIYVGIESIIVKTLGDSSFETLEALGPAITGSVRRNIKDVTGPAADGISSWVIKVVLEKPTAITMAAASRVEYRELPNTSQ
ncbi:dihydroneopterin aldolase family protein [Colletotrichum truncatum]|uniref:Dihydroneopterin aldolase family protein n=1 Tax=Colletotrichum truncatum TaxID=5467 RepID=A0ACC3Z5P2_COLTU|nr:dihydroneopterin aldolase family protein [Colletotrichum truncatum]KAF6795266.1 dihydroneopterin aldolase family protein [Colletotrichum truncatum]